MGVMPPTQHVILLTIAGHIVCSQCSLIHSSANLIFYTGTRFIDFPSEDLLEVEQHSTALNPRTMSDVRCLSVRFEPSKCGCSAEFVLVKVTETSKCDQSQLNICGLELVQPLTFWVVVKGIR